MYTILIGCGASVVLAAAALLAVISFATWNTLLCAISLLVAGGDVELLSHLRGWLPASAGKAGSWLLYVGLIVAVVHACRVVLRGHR